MIEYNTRKAFTLAELMVCLLLVSVLATILLPAIIQNKPNKSKVMFRKSYYIIERVVSELINDEDLYPNDKENNTMGFANVAEVVYAGNHYSGTTKFCNLFYEKLNTTTSSPNCSTSRETPSAVPVENAEGTFITNDGVIWYLPASKIFASSNFESTEEVENGDGTTTPASPAGRIEQELSVDINGINKPNCYFDENTCKDPDRFKVFVRFDGKVRVDGEKEREYLMSNTTLR